METLYSQTAWPLYAKFKHAYDAFRAAIGDPDSIFNEETMPGAPSRLLAHLLALLLAIDRRPPVQPRLLLSPPRPSRPPPPFPSPPHPSSPRPPSSSSGLDINLRKAILDDICKRLTPTAIKIRADIEVTCFHYEGINAIRSALLKGAELAAPEVPAPPRPTSPSAA